MKVYQGTQSNSNCLTYIPQDIKLELNNGTLTLKAGSKVYVPNGFEQNGTTPKFDIVITTQDYNTGDISSITEQYTEMYNTTGNVASSRTSTSYSGSTAPSSPQAGYLWYDTTNNLVKRYNGSSWITGFSLPFALLHSGATSIDQVFNGFGYIGSTLFALPGVKGLIPNGRNVDNTLKSITAETNSVSILTLNGTGTRDIIPDSSGVAVTLSTTYNRGTNYLYNSSSIIIYRFYAGTLILTDNKITSLLISKVKPETIPIYKVTKGGTRRNYYKYTYSAWTRPNVSGFSVLGGDNFAIANGGTYQLWAMFDGNTSSWGQMYSTNEDARTLKFFNPDPIQINSFTTKNYANTYLADATWYGSNDGENWTTIFSFTNSTSSTTQTISFPENSGYYKYFKMRVDRFVGYFDATEITFDATVKNTVASTSSDYDFYEDIDIYKAF